MNRVVQYLAQDLVTRYWWVQSKEGLHFVPSRRRVRGQTVRIGLCGAIRRVYSSRPRPFVHRRFDQQHKPEYVMRRIREDYLGDSTVTIILIGTCTHSRRFVDWEIKASLQQGAALPNGLVGILLPSATPGLLRMRHAELPPRLSDNLAQAGVPGYAQYQPYPTSRQQVREWIEDAFNSRTRRAQYISNGRRMMSNYNSCANCGATHQSSMSES
jgi:hypothetical protein